MLPLKKVSYPPFFPSILLDKIPSVSDLYTSEWKNTRTPCPPIKKVYMVVMKPDFTLKYEEYRYQFIYLNISGASIFIIASKDESVSFNELSLNI